MKPNRTRLPLTTAVASLAALALALAGCSAAAEPAADEPSGQGASWPRTIEIPAGARTPASTLTIEAQPQRIAALDYESAEVLAELGFADRLVLIPEAVLNPVLGGHAEELSDVEASFPVAMDVDAETVIDLAPDLAVMSPRHGNEEPIATVLQDAGIAALQLPDSWVSSDSLSTNIGLIGQATGGEEQAEKLIGEIEEGLADAAASTSGEADDAPRVLMLTNQAGRPFVTAGGAYPIELLGLAGARNAADDLGIDRTGPISAEQIVRADPDGIVLIDMNGTGDRMFAELLANPAVAATPAIAQDHVLRVQGRQVQALGLTDTVEGLAGLTEWVAEL